MTNVGRCDIIYVLLLSDVIAELLERCLQLIKSASVLDIRRVKIGMFAYAGVAELADALASGSVTTVNLFAWLLSGSS